MRFEKVDVERERVVLVAFEEFADFSAKVGRFGVFFRQIVGEWTAEDTEAADFSIGFVAPCY